LKKNVFHFFYQIIHLRTQQFNKGQAHYVTFCAVDITEKKGKLLLSMCFFAGAAPLSKGKPTPIRRTAYRQLVANV
jgi:hypothetical protein